MLEKQSEGADGDFAFLSSSFILFRGFERISPMISLDYYWSVYMVCCFPRVVCIGVPFPLDKILELSFTSEVMVINDGLDFIFLGVFDKVRRWPRVVRPVFGGFMIGGQEGCMEDVMNGPGHREL